MSGVRRLAKNTLALFTTSMGRIVLGLVLQLYVARRLGAGGLGKYAVVLAFVAIFQVVTELGLSRLLIRELARQRGTPHFTREAGRYFWGAVSVQIVGAFLAYGLLITAVQLLGYKQDTSRALYIAGLGLFPHAITSACEACFQAMERMELVAGVETASYAVQFGLAVALLAGGHGVVALGGVILLAEVLAAVLSLWVALRIGFLLPLRFDLAFSWQLTRAAPPFFLLALSVIAYSRLDVIMISKLMGERAAGVYSAAYLIVRAVSLISTAYSDALYPALSRLHDDISARERLSLAGRKALQYGLTLVLPVAAGIAVLAPALIRMLYSSNQYTEASRVLRLVIWETVPFLANAVLSRLLIASNLQRLSVRVAVVKLVAATIYYATLIPLFGLPGAAVATVLATFTGTGMNLRFVGDNVVRLSLWQISFKVIAATGLMVVVMLVLPNWQPWAIASLAVVVYVVLLLGMQAFASEDWLLLRTLVRPRSIG